MHKKIFLLSLALVLVTSTLPELKTQAFIGSNVNCDVIIYGGSTSALFAAITSARENKVTCLIEPTDWVGGQLTNSVPAIDWQWMKNINPTHGNVDGQQPHTLRRNNNFMFWDWVNNITPQGSCWVSRDCFLGKDLLEKTIKPYLATLPNLKIHYNTVVKSLNMSTTTNGLKRINQVNAIKRTALSGTGYDKKLSDDMMDWYSVTNSPRFTKTNLIFGGNNGKNPVIVEGSELSELLPLAGASYLQGAQVYDGSLQTLNESCGQSITSTFNMKMNQGIVAENGPARNSFDNTYGTFDFGTKDWDNAWNYRRLTGTGNPYVASIASGQISLMNWKNSPTYNNGNDYAKAYLYKGYQQTLEEVTNWQGGINYATLKGSEDVSSKFYYFMKDNEPRGNGNRLNLDNASMGTTTGFYKFPYIRDTRRSVGIDNYLLKNSELLVNNPTGARFADSIATASYPMDIHPIDNCSYSNDDKGLTLKQGQSAEPYPFYIPLRALTNKDVVNLVVAGKSIAQTFKTAAATRLQPGEATTGTAAGAFASYLHTTGKTTYDIVIPTTGTYKAQVLPIQNIVKKYQAIDWVLNNGLTYPSSTEYLRNVRSNYNCPDGAIPDLSEGYCVDANNAYGHFSNTMTNNCISAGGGPSCTEAISFQVGSKTISATRWSKLFTRKLRGDGVCPIGLTLDITYKDYCVQGSGSTKEVFGPFTKTQTERCFNELQGGLACYTNRWNYNFVTPIL